MAGSFLESFLQLKKETVWGTPVGANVRVPVLSWDVQPSYDSHDSGMITGAAGQAAPLWGVKRVAGKATFEGGYGGQDQMWYGALGGVTAVSGAADPWVVRFTPSATIPSFTAEVGYGDIPTGKVFVFSGLKVNTLDFSWDASSGLSNMSVDLIGENEESTTTTGTTTTAATTTVTHEPIQVMSQVTTHNVGFGAYSAYCVRSGNIKVERFLSANRICVGSTTVKEPVPTQPMKVSGTFNVEFTDRVAYEAFVAHTVETVTQFKWTGTAANVHYIDIVMPKVVYTSALPPIQSGDVLVAPINWIAYGSAGSGATSEPINVTVATPVVSTAL